MDLDYGNCDLKMNAVFTFQQSGLGMADKLKAYCFCLPCAKITFTFLLSSTVRILVLIYIYA